LPLVLILAAARFLVDVVALLALVCLAFFPPVIGSAADSSRLFLDATVDLKLRGLTLEY
jgi:hypothetical protein